MPLGTNLPSFLFQRKWFSASSSNSILWRFKPLLRLSSKTSYVNIRSEEMAVLMMAKHRIQAVQIGIILARSYAKTARAGYNRNLYYRLRNSKSSVDEAMNEWIKQGKPISATDIGKLIPKFARSEYRDKALQLIQWMENNGMDINHGLEARRILLISKTRGIEFAEQKFYNLPINKKNEKTYGTLLGCYCKLKMEDKAEALFVKMSDTNFTNRVSYNLIMALYTELGNPLMVHAYFRKMKSDKITPDEFTLEPLLYLSLHDIISVEIVFEEMRGNFSLYATMASYFNSKGAYDKTSTTLKKAEEVMDKTERNQFYTLMSLYAGAGNEIETLKVWSLLSESFEKLTNKCHYSFLVALRKLGDIDGMRECFDQWESKCVKFDASLMNLMVDCYLEKEMVHEAESLRKRILEKRGAPC